MINSTAPASRRKSSSSNGWSKPFDDFPLSYHPPSERLYKKIRGKRHYFGYAREWQEAVDKYLDQKEDLQAGRRPRSTGDGLIVQELCNRFLTSKQNQVAIGEITHRSFLDYKAVTDRIVRVFGLKRQVEYLLADDFEQLKADIAETRGLVALGNEIQRCRVVFNFAWQNHLVAKPIRFGSTFKRPSKRLLRRARNGNASKMFEAEEILAMLGMASAQMKAMLLLGVNCGYGNSDCGTLPMDAVDLDGGWIEYPRPKTGIERRCPLWRETIDALRDAMSARPEPKPGCEYFIFLTVTGGCWHTDSPSNPLSREFRKLLQRIDASGNIKNALYRKGRGFYALRHVFETIGGESRDQVAVDHIMGHADQSMAAHYRERISDERLQNVVDYVRKWLYGGSTDV